MRQNKHAPPKVALFNVDVKFISAVDYLPKIVLERFQARSSK